jgi:hypothetical protein
MKTRGLSDIIFAPIIFFLSNDLVESLRLLSLRMERINICLENCQGKVLDIGYGEGNRLIKKWRLSGKNGIGIDIYSWKDVS